MRKKVKLIITTLIFALFIAFGTTMAVFAARNAGLLSDYSIDYISPYSSLISGTDMCLALKKARSSTLTNYATADSYCESIIFDSFEPYSSTFDWDTDSSTLLDSTTNCNIKLFTSGKTYYVLSVTDISCSDCKNMFYNFTALKSVTFNNFKPDDIVSLENMFYGDSALTTISGFNKMITNKATSTAGMFYNCSSLSSIDLSTFDFSSATTTSKMFSGCSALTTIDLSSSKLSKVTTMEEMFSGCTGLTTLNLSGVTTSTALTNMVKMFYNCSTLTTLNLSSITTTSVTNMTSLFEGCSSLSSLNLSSFTTANLTTTEKMFKNCSALTTLNLYNITTDNVTNMNEMFYGIKVTTLNLGFFDTNKVTNMNGMFASMTNLTTISVSNLWSTLVVASSTNMFQGDTKLVGGKGTTYSTSHLDKGYAHVDLSDQEGYLTAIDVQYKGVYIYDEYNNLLTISYIASNEPFVLPERDECDYYMSDSTRYQIGDTAQYSSFSGQDNAEFIMYLKRYSVTLSDGDNSANVSRTVSCVLGGSPFTITSGSTIPKGTEVSISVSTTGGSGLTSYSNAKCEISPSSVKLNTITQYSEYSFIMPGEAVTITFSCSKNSCVASGTLITLANGEQKKVEDITLEDRLLVANHENGLLEECEINFIECEDVDWYNVINLEFSNGAVCRAIYEHGYFNATLGKYVYMTEETYLDYVGDSFYALDGDETTTVTLDRAYITCEYTGCYSLTTTYHLNYFTDGILSMPGGIYGIFNIFDCEEGSWQYDLEKMAEDIEMYGLFDYEILSEYVSIDTYNLYPTKYFAVAMAKGILDWNQLFYLIERYC